VKHAYEDAVEDGILGIEVLQRAQQELLTPRLRINAEVAGLIDIAPNLASQLISRLQAGASRATLTELIASLHALPKSNVLAHLATQAIANEKDLIELLDAQVTVPIGGTCDAINDAREQAGFVRTDQDSVAKALATLEERQIRSVVTHAATSGSFAQTFVSFTRMVLNVSDYVLTTKLALYVAAYGQAIAKQLYDEFAQAVSITVDTELADLPWRLVREIAISLNNDSQSPGAAGRLIDGLVSHFSLHRPSDDMVIVLKNDQDAARKNILQRDLVENLKHERLSDASTVAGKLVEIEKDAEELAALERTRDVIAAKQRSIRNARWGWFAAAVVLVFFVAIGSQEKSSGRSSSSHSPPPSYSPPPSTQLSPSRPPAQDPWQDRPTYRPPAQDPWQDRPTYSEERPPVGTGLSLTQANIRYCAFQTARLDSARTVVTAERDITRFNSLIQDLNSRCSNYRYRPSDKAVVDGEVSARRPILQAEGRALFRSEATAR
jgi:hypothetical protein